MALYVFGAIFVVGIYLMMMWIWPSGWSWTPFWYLMPRKAKAD
jgi:sterol desaturase/sphingolipid hydroxylase (fatty acid hydroxylase superfamily)